MKVLMLGWEYPPHISGGLGTACLGLTTALARTGIAIEFVMPQLTGDELAAHMIMINASDGTILGESKRKTFKNESLTKTKKINKTKIPALLSPYLNLASFDRFVSEYKSILQQKITEEYESSAVNSEGQLVHYGNDIFDEVSRYASNVVEIAENLEFDVIHAHDWMTFPAALAVSRLSGKPFVAHIHSLEFDRSGAHMNQRIHEVENIGLTSANAVIAVSHYTASIIMQYHGVDQGKINIVHNGVYSNKIVQTYRHNQGWQSKVVLFLGRITFQKGPDYFVEAAGKVIQHLPDVVFIMAGSGDMLPRMVERVHQLGIAKNFHFPGFLNSEEVEQIFSAADLYVMPSVSEPFGISALEAISYDTPVIISKQSGVSEVLGHALKVDFWDVERMADLIINSLIHEELREDMSSMAKEELKRLRWDASALKTLEVYRKLM